MSNKDQNLSDRDANAKKQAQDDANRDPLSGRAGAHPVGTGVGAAVGGVAAGVATGAAIGAVGGPVGMAAGAAIGAAVGAIGGGLAGKAVAESINPTVEHGYWQREFVNRPYILPGLAYEDYAPAYQYGWESQSRYSDKTFEEAEAEVREGWDHAKGSSRLTWDKARSAVRDSWNRMTNQTSNVR